MSTDKQRFSITVDDDFYRKIEDFRFERRIKSQSKAVNELMEMGFCAIMGKEISIQPNFSKQEINIIEKYRDLDDHGKRMVDLVLKEEHSRISSSTALHDEGVKIAKEVQAEMLTQKVD